MRPPLRVVKVGGSLLRHQPDAQAKDSIAAVGIRDLLERWLAEQPPATSVLLAGGGEFTDIIRRADAKYRIGEEAAHWLCVDAMSLTARLLGTMANVAVLTRAEEVPDSQAVCVFDPGPFLHDVEPKLFAASLPHTWAVTSDSIAARLAEFLHADELVLLKSCLPEAADYVDEYFPAAAARLPRVRCVNFRSSQFEELVWAEGS